MVLRCPICSGRTASRIASSSMIFVVYNISIASVTVGHDEKLYTYKIYKMLKDVKMVNLLHYVLVLLVNFCTDVDAGMID